MIKITFPESFGISFFGVNEAIARGPMIIAKLSGMKSSRALSLYALLLSLTPSFEQRTLHYAD